GVCCFVDEAPLNLPDGTFLDNIAFLNSIDIEGMSVLKDASGAAIYDVWAANGVILVPTKKGRLNIKTRISYSVYAGVQRPSNLLKMATGEQYANYASAIGNQSIVDNSISKFGGTNGVPSTNTDWYNELLRSNAA